MLGHSACIYAWPEHALDFAGVHDSNLAEIVILFSCVCLWSASASSSLVFLCFIVTAVSTEATAGAGSESSCASLCQAPSDPQASGARL